MSELTQDFFPPVPTGQVSHLVAEYKSLRQRIEQVAELFRGEFGGVVHHFVNGNRKQDNSRYSRIEAEKIFQSDGAVAALNADYWQRAMSITDVWDCLPQKRRDEWHTQIREMTCPDFEEESVRATLETLLSSRYKFFAERVDGIFRSLSRDHVTNSPMGFSKRMILNYALDQYHHVNHTTAGYINDLRCVIAKFMGRDDPSWNLTTGLIRGLVGSWGEWHSFDGGSMRIRIYKKGTAHLEVHPDMAWRLNGVLASLYPAAIPSQFRTKPTAKPKDFVMMERPLPFQVLSILDSLLVSAPFNRSILSDNHIMIQEAGSILEAIGGIKVSSRSYQFDYDPKSVIADIVRSGCIPDHRSYQFYPTPPEMAEKAVMLAEIEPGHTCLEPSAGNGGLADFMPKDQTTCVELTDLRCKVLESKGYKWMQADFLTLDLCERYDRIILNPPFSEGRWKLHTEKAASLLSRSGRLVAILPESARNSGLLPDMQKEWHGSWSFPGTSINVVMLVAS